MPGQSKKFRAKVKESQGTGRTAGDYGIPGLDDATLEILAGNPGRYGEKSRFASQELGQRRGLYGQANQYRAALEAAAYRDAGAQYSQGLGQISNYLARSGPLYDSGAGTALRRSLAGQIYGAASGRIGNQFASYLGNIMNQNRQYNYQRQLLAYQRRLNRRNPLEAALAAAGGIAGNVAGYGYGGGGSGGYVANKFGEPD